MSEIKPLSVKTAEENFGEWMDKTGRWDSQTSEAKAQLDSLKNAERKELRAAYEAKCNEVEQLQKENEAQAKLLTEQDYQYNKQTNEIIARHAEQLEVAAEFCRQYQIENAQLKEKLQIRDNQLASKKAVIEELEKGKDHLQFLLDSVMLEYCPEEMTEEQMENWSKHQKKSNLEIL